MTTNKRKKVVKYRAHTTHGGGHRKKRRGAGNRGGRGRAGSGKRGKAKKQCYKPLGAHGFSPRGIHKKIKVINISDLNRLIQKNKLDASKAINLTALGYQKLLGAGKTNLKLDITIKEFSKQAEEKIKAAGGSISSAIKEVSQETPQEKVSEKPEE